MELTREEALRLHRKMWTEMQEALGDCPSFQDRSEFKLDWCLDHTPECIPQNDCYLCEYVSQISASCSSCPIDWSAGRHVYDSYNCVDGGVDYFSSPISDILALPERKEKKK